MPVPGRGANDMSAAPVVGALALHTVLGTDPELLLEAVELSRSGLAPLPHWPGPGDAPSLACLPGDPEDVEDDPALRILGPHGRTLEPVMRALYQAAYVGRLPPDRVGLHVGMGAVDSVAAELAPALRGSRHADGSVDFKRFFARGYKLLHPLWPLSMLNNVAAGQIATDLDVRGDNLVTSSDAPGGARALLEAARTVRDGTVTGSLAAGVAESIGPASLARRTLIGPLATAADPEGQRPGDGAAALWLEPAAQARLAGRPTDVQLAGGATTFRSRAPGEALARAIPLACARAGVALEDLALVMLHQPGAPLDDAEQQAVARAMGRDAARLHPSRSLGDLGAAAPALHCALAATYLRNREVGSGQWALITAVSTGGSAAALVLVYDEEGRTR